MFNRIFKLTLVLAASLSNLSFAGCCGGGCAQSVDIGVGWRRDNLKWHTQDMEGSYRSAHASSNFHFENIEMYTVNGKARWAASEFYIRLSGDYGSSIKGRAHQNFVITSPILDGTLCTHVSNPVKRRSEFFDFTGAVGYPFVSRCRCILAVPLVGFSFHRQRIRVKEGNHNSFSSDFSLSSSNPFFSSSSLPESSSSSFSSDNESDFFDPFSSRSASNVAELIGFSLKKHVSDYRFTWYGPFIGLDILYGLDDRWTLFTELEYHFLDRSHRKRKSLTAVDFVDEYHSKRWSYGFNATIGTTWDMGACWYSTIAVDFKWWRSPGLHDVLTWKSTDINISLGYMF